MSSTLTKVWILFGSTGEYSDRSEWVVRAYTTKEDADADCAALNKLAEGLSSMSWAQRSAAVTERLQPHDANADADYTGTSYMVGECEVVDRAQIPVA